MSNYDYLTSVIRSAFEACCDECRDAPDSPQSQDAERVLEALDKAGLEVATREYE